MPLLFSENLGQNLTSQVLYQQLCTISGTTYALKNYDLTLLMKRVPGCQESSEIVRETCPKDLKLPPQ